MRIFLLASILFAHLSYSESTTKEESLMNSLDEIFQEDLRQIEKQKEMIKDLRSQMSGCYYEEESFSFLKALIYKNCADVLLEAKEKSISYYQMKKITERYNLKGAFETLQRVYGEELQTIYENQKDQMQVLRQELEHCKYEEGPEMEDIALCYDLLLSSKEDGLSYLQLESVIQE